MFAKTGGIGIGYSIIDDDWASNIGHSVNNNATRRVRVVSAGKPIGCKIISFEREDMRSFVLIVTASVFERKPAETHKHSQMK
jgi:hypothetical protein